MSFVQSCRKAGSDALLIALSSPHLNLASPKQASPAPILPMIGKPAVLIRRRFDKDFAFVAADALVLKVREARRVVNVHALIAVGVNAGGYRKILGVDVSTAEDGAGWLTFWVR